MKRVKIDWDTDGLSIEECGLPEYVEIPDPIDHHDIADMLSDEYGFCINSLTLIKNDNEK